MKTHFTTTERKIIYFSNRLRVPRKEIGEIIDHRPEVVYGSERRRWFKDLDREFGSVCISEIDNLRDQTIKEYRQIKHQRESTDIDQIVGKILSLREIQRAIEGPKALE